MSDLVHVVQDVAQLVPERLAALDQVGGGLEQVLVGDDLASGREQQRRHRLVAAHPALRHVLLADAQRLVRQFLLDDVGGASRSTSATIS